MSVAIQFDPIRLPPEAEALRLEVREFLKEEMAAGTFDGTPDRRPNPEFSRKVGEKGWIGITWPKNAAFSNVMSSTRNSSSPGRPPANISPPTGKAGRS
jgi:alkylation response protein AidB-like acyl-CoA dehydrogenase